MDTANRAALLTEAGQALYGQRWQSELARNLGLSSMRRIREYATGERRPPDRVLAAVLELLRARDGELSSVRERLIETIESR